MLSTLVHRRVGGETCVCIVDRRTLWSVRPGVNATLTRYARQGCSCQLASKKTRTLSTFLGDAPGSACARSRLLQNSSLRLAKTVHTARLYLLVQMGATWGTSRLPHQEHPHPAPTTEQANAVPSVMALTVNSSSPPTPSAYLYSLGYLSPRPEFRRMGFHLEHFPESWWRVVRRARR